jgi:ferritin-like metal-binding protein YciE
MQLLKALPKMAKAATADKLRQAFEGHLEQTKGHVQRLESIFDELDEWPGRKRCRAMESLIAEGEEFLNEDALDAVRDAGLIAIAQRVEHYEIAAYGTAATYARHLGNAKAEKLLRETLAEESETDKKLTKLAEISINFKAEQSA